MANVKRTVVIVTEQRIDPNKPAPDPQFPMRNWLIQLSLLHSHTQELLPATCFEKIQYVLHPTFGARAKQIKKTPPFRIEEEGWGEFDLLINPTPLAGGGGKEMESISHDLNFRSERYEARHEVTFRGVKAGSDLARVLAQSGDLPDALTGGAANGVGGKKRKGGKSVDMEKLADGLQKLDEESLLHVVQLVHEHKSAETYAKNDVENGEFHVDLYTLPDNLVKMLWDFTESKGML